MDSRIGKHFLKAIGIDMNYIEESTKQFAHLHEMLTKLFPEIHGPIHEHCEHTTDNKLPKEYRELAVNGGCVYNVVSFLFIEKFGQEAYNIDMQLYLKKKEEDVKNGTN
jgi:hypothetical protein